jgi:hypothetical protein
MNYRQRVRRVIVLLRLRAILRAAPMDRSRPFDRRKVKGVWGC